METSELFNSHNKDEYPPSHTAEHLLNQLMVRMFGCSRSTNAHIERKKSKISYILNRKPDRKTEKEIEYKMKELIAEDMRVTYETVMLSDLIEETKGPDCKYEGVDIDRLPANVSDAVRIVRIGDYDICPCIGKHVRSTSQIGRFELLGTNWDETNRSFRIRYKVVEN